MSENKNYIAVQLSEPIMLQGEKTTELRLEKPKLKHLQAMDELNLEVDQAGGIRLGKVGSVIIRLATDLGNLTEREAGEIPLQDLKAIGAAFKDFFGDFLATGGNTPG